jgi:hypothetical protein
LCFVDSGYQFKIEAFVQQFASLYFGFAICIQAFKNGIVFLKLPVYFQHMGVTAAVAFIVVGIPALVGTEFFIDSSNNHIATNRTGSFFSHGIEF